MHPDSIRMMAPAMSLLLGLSIGAFLSGFVTKWLLMTFVCLSGAFLAMGFSGIWTSSINLDLRLIAASGSMAGVIGFILGTMLQSHVSARIRKHVGWALTIVSAGFSLVTLAVFAASGPPLIRFISTIILLGLVAIVLLRFARVLPPRK